MLTSPRGEDESGSNPWKDREESGRPIDAHCVQSLRFVCQLLVRPGCCAQHRGLRYCLITTEKNALRNSRSRVRVVYCTSSIFLASML